MAGKLLGNLLSPLTEQEIQEDIRNFKRILAAGDIPTIKGQSSGRHKDAQVSLSAPEEVYA